MKIKIFECNGRIRGDDDYSDVVTDNRYVDNDTPWTEVTPNEYYALLSVAAMHNRLNESSLVIVHEVDNVPVKEKKTINDYLNEAKGLIEKEKARADSRKKREETRKNNTEKRRKDKELKLLAELKAKHESD